MKAVVQLKRTVFSEELGIASEESGHAFSITGVYQDTVTFRWAVQMCRPVTQLAGKEWVRQTWHEVASLSDPHTLSDAVQATLRADVSVVSAYAADELPVGLCAWIDA